MIIDRHGDVTEDCFCGCGRKVDSTSNSLTKDIVGSCRIYRGLVCYHPETVEKLRQLGFNERAMYAEAFGTLLAREESRGRLYLRRAITELHEDGELSSELRVAVEANSGVFRAWENRAEIFAYMTELHVETQGLYMKRIVEGDFPEELFDLIDRKRSEAFVEDVGSADWPE